MKKRAIFFILLYSIILLTIFSSSSNKDESVRYIVEIDENTNISDLKSKIIDEIEINKNSRQKAGVKLDIGKKKIVISNSSIQDLEKKKGVYRIELDHQVKILNEETLPWNYQAIGFNFTDIDNDLGNGIKIAVLDTGINPNLVSVADGYDFVNEDSDPSDDNGHGTFVSEILKFPITNEPLNGAQIYSLKVLNSAGEGYVSDVLEAINWAINNNIDIIIMSFGGELDSSFEKEAMDEAYSAGILLIAAGGNEGKNNILYPANYYSVVAIGSVNEELKRSSFSNYGTDLELVAPGENITVYDGTNYYLVTGTSFSVPHVAIVAASYWGDNLNKNNIEIRNLLKDSALDLGIKGKDDEFGEGLVMYKIKNEEINTLAISHGKTCNPFNIFNQCVSGLVCDGDGQFFGDSVEGCCNIEENWNGESLLCNSAVTGKIYQVNQNGQNFIESPFGNLKLRIFIQENDVWPNPDNVFTYFDINSDSEGNFNFNPERKISPWNWNSLIANYQINSIYIIQNNEIIGKWTNQFSNNQPFKNGRESVNQIVRVHKDKNTWRNAEFPKIDPLAGVLSVQSLKIDSIGLENPVHINWEGKLNISKTGNYKFIFNVSGNIKLKINSIIIIDSIIDNKKEGSIYLNNLQNNVTFEFYESGDNNPKIYWQYENEEIKEITEQNLIKQKTKTTIVNEIDKLSALALSEVNNQPDYMIYFLEEPETIRNTKPLILVHGKHGESGYWSKGNAQNLFNNNGYDAWEFYYPGDDYIDKNGALLGDALDYLKRNLYGQNQKFDIISHSMGGLVSRSYIQDISPYNYQNDINRLVMIGSPNYGAGSSVGISERWPLTPSQKFIAEILLCGTISTYSELEDCRINRIGEWQSPIYKQMSLGSELISSLSRKILSTKSIIITGNKESVDINSFESWLCSQVDNIGGHQEGEDLEHDCLVAIASSSLLNKNVPLVVINNKNHATEKDNIEDYMPLILSFLRDESDTSLADKSFAYYNPTTNFKKNFNYQEGSAQIKLIENGKIWDEFSNAELKIERSATGERFKMTRNIYSKNYFHFNREDDRIDSYYTIPTGAYKLIVPSYSDSQKLNFTIKPMETNFLEINLTKEQIPLIPSLKIIAPLNNSVINSSELSVVFNTSNWQIGGKGDKHVHFHVEGVSGLSFSDHLMFFNGNDKIVELNFGNGGTKFATWISENTLRLNNLSNGFYKLRVHLANPDHSPLINSEADTTILFIVNKTVPLPIIHHPLEGEILNKRKILINVSVGKTVKFIKYQLDGKVSRNGEGVYIDLCRNCNHTEKFITFREGNHTLGIVAIQQDDTPLEDSVKFLVDSTAPSISKTLPKKNTFTNGSNFVVEYDEDNLKYIRLSWNPNITKTNCPNGDNKECQFNANLTKYNGQAISYWFELEDITGNKDISNKINVFVDTISPIVRNFNYTINNNRIRFILNISETNFNIIEYKDYNDRSPKFRTLCRKLKNEICDVSKSFSKGTHEVDIRVLDKAGNSALKRIQFQIV